MEFLLIFLVALGVSLALTRLVRDRARAWGWLDMAQSSRKVHANPTPRLGGIGIACGFFAPLCAAFLVDSRASRALLAQPQLVEALFGGGLVVLALGLYDDLRGARARVKLAVQVAVALGLYALGFRVELIANPFGSNLPLGMLALPFTLLWVVGVINALNLIDGLDGLAGGVAFFGVGTNFILALSRGDVLLSLLMAALAGAILGFLVYNFNPASIFMGDSGSLFLGFVLAAVSIKTSTKSGTAVAMLVPIMALGLPIMDTLLAMVRRSLVGRPIFSSDKEHIHHRLLSRLSHRGAVLVLYGVCALFTLTALALNYANTAQSALLLCGMAVVVAVLMRKLGYLDLAQARGVGELRQRNLRLRSAVKEVTGQVRRATSRAALWAAVSRLGEVLEASRVELLFKPRPERGWEEDLYWLDREAGEALPLEVRLDMEEGAVVLGWLLVVWRDGRQEVGRDEELALELVADAVAEQARRLGPEPAAVVRPVAAVGR